MVDSVMNNGFDFDRVVFAADLADVMPAEIDAFLDTLEVEPFTDEQVERILGRLDLGGVCERTPTVESIRRLPARRSLRRTQGYRLSCEELENRLPPSSCSTTFAAELDFRMAVLPVNATVRQWEARPLMEIHGSADAAEEASAHAWDGSTGAPVAESDVPWDALFSDFDSPVSCELQLAG
jgi:hypothetical protein